MPPVSSSFVVLDAPPPNAAQEVLSAMNLVDDNGNLDVSGLTTALRCSQDVAAGVLPLYYFPSELRTALSRYDTDHNETLETGEILGAFAALEGQNQILQRHSFPLSTFPESLREEIRKLDDNNDDALDMDEIVEGVKALHREKQKNRLLIYLLFSMIGFLLVFLACTSGLMFAVLEATRESSISKGGVMTVKGSTSPVMVASSDVQVVDGVLAGRCIGQCANTSASSSALQISQASFPMKLSSLVDDAYLRELKYMTVGQGESFVHFQVFAVARYPEKGSRTGTVVVIYTHLGEITIDGEALLFHESIRGAFARAGLLVDETTGRRLLGLVEVLGFFNKLNKLLANVSQDRANDYPRLLPLTFEARKRRILVCKEDDCSVDGKTVDWASQMSDGKLALESVEDLWSLTIQGLHVGKAVQSSEQWPEQTLTTLQNETHNLTFQTYRGVNYYCRMNEDESLKKSIEERRRRAGEEPPTIHFLGFKTINDVYCRHFLIPNSTIHIFEDYFQSRIYQVQMSNLLTWRFERFTAITNESANSLSPADFNLDAILQSCDPKDTIRPDNTIVEGLLSNSITPQPTWGTESAFQGSSTFPADLLANLSSWLNQTINTTLLNLTGTRAGLNYSSRRDSDTDHPININDLIYVSEEEYARQRDHARRLLGEGCNLEIEEKSWALPPIDILFMKKWSLLSINVKPVFRCTGSDLPDVQGGLIAMEYTISKSTGTSISCISVTGGITAYIPIETGGYLRGMFAGYLDVGFILSDCFFGMYPSYIRETAGFIFDMAVGVRLFLQYPNPLQEMKCPYQDCYGYGTYLDSNCWLKTKAAFDRPGVFDPPTKSYIQTTGNSDPKSFYKKSDWDYPGADLAYYYRRNPTECQMACRALPDCFGVVTRADVHCWLKPKSVFDGPGKADSGTNTNTYIQKTRFFEKQRGINYPGTDLQYYAVNPDACEQQCHLNPACYGFVTFADAHCWLKPKSAFDRVGMVDSGTTSYVQKSWFFELQQGLNWPGDDLQYLTVDPTECGRQCYRWAAEKNKRFGDLEKTLYFSGEGYGWAKGGFGSISAEVKIRAAAFRATACGTMQQPGTPLQAGYGVFVETSLKIRTWWYSDSWAWAMNMIPGNQMYCGNPDSTIFNTKDNSMYRIYPIDGTQCQRL